MTDIHNLKRRLEGTLAKVKNSSICEENKKAIFDFHNFCFSEGIGAGKVQRYVFDLEKIANLLKKDFDKCNRQDIQNVVGLIEKMDYAPETKRGIRISIKKFFKWLRKIDDKGVYPDEVKWMSTTSKNGSHRLPEELLTEQDIVKLINASGNKRDRAFISVLYESGARITEVMTIKIKNISFDDLGARINVFGKTGSRRIRLVSSAVYLQEWLNEHPDKDNPDSFVWIKTNNELIGYARIGVLLKRIAKRAGVKKRVNPHSFRHARATYLANFLTEAQLKEVFGWTQGSKMSAIYVHLSSRDTDEAILKVYGKVIKDKTKEKSLLTPRECLRCKTQNEATNKFCKLCGFVLDKQEADKIIQTESERQNMDELMNKLINNKDVLKMLIEKMVEINKNA